MMNGTTSSRSSSSSPLVKVKRIYGSGGSNHDRDAKEQQPETEVAKRTADEAETVDRVTKMATDLEEGRCSPSETTIRETRGESESPSEPDTDSEAPTGGCLPSTESAECEERGEEEGKGEEERDTYRKEKQLSPGNLSGQIESSLMVSEDGVEGESASSSSETVSAPKVDRFVHETCHS